jgi:hypothetical protein
MQIPYKKALTAPFSGCTVRTIKREGRGSNGTKTDGNRRNPYCAAKGGAVMAETTEWVAYEREWGRNHTLAIKRSDEPSPIKHHLRGPATAEEIACEITRRAEKKAESDMLAAFQARQDFKDAVAIRAMIEWISPSDHCLDKLTPAEWAELRRRLEA